MVRLCLAMSEWKWGCLGLSSYVSMWRWKCLSLTRKFAWVCMGAKNLEVSCGWASFGHCFSFLPCVSMVRFCLAMSEFIHEYVEMKVAREPLVFARKGVCLLCGNKWVLHGGLVLCMGSCLCIVYCFVWFSFQDSRELELSFMSLHGDSIVFAWKWLMSLHGFVSSHVFAFLAVNVAWKMSPCMEMRVSPCMEMNVVKPWECMVLSFPTVSVWKWFAQACCESLV